MPTMRAPLAKRAPEVMFLPWLETKILDETAGTFEGYLAVKNNVDLGNDRVKDGAFAKTIQSWQARFAQSKWMPYLWQHDPSEPIGGFTELREDPRGLYVKGFFDLDIEEGRRAYSGFKKGYLSGLSMGYEAIKKSFDGSVRDLLEVKLWEGSAATFPMNTEAEVTQVKTLTGAPPEAESAHDGVMVACYLPPDIAQTIAVDGGEAPADLHLTLVYLGGAAELGEAKVQTILRVAQEYAGTCAPVDGQISGLGRFAAGDSSGGSDVIYASFDAPALPELRQGLVAALEAAGIAVARTHGYTPHITLSYVQPGAQVDMTNPPLVPVRFEAMQVRVGGEAHSYPFVPSDGGDGGMDFDLYDRLEAIWRAVRALGTIQDGDWSYPRFSVECPRTTSVVIEDEETDQLYLVPYTVDSEGAVTLGEMQPVDIAYLPAQKARARRFESKAGRRNSSTDKQKITNIFEAAAGLMDPDHTTASLKSVFGSLSKTQRADLLSALQADEPDATPKSVPGPAAAGTHPDEGKGTHSAAGAAVDPEIERMAMDTLALLQKAAVQPFQAVADPEAEAMALLTKASTNLVK